MRARVPVAALDRHVLSHEARQIVETAPKSVELVRRLVDLDRVLDSDAALMWHAGCRMRVCIRGVDAEQIIKWAAAGGATKQQHAAGEHPWHASFRAGSAEQQQTTA